MVTMKKYVAPSMEEIELVSQEDIMEVLGGSGETVATKPPRPQ